MAQDLVAPRLGFCPLTITSCRATCVCFNHGHIFPLPETVFKPDTTFTYYFGQCGNAMFFETEIQVRL